MAKYCFQLQYLERSGAAFQAQSAKGAGGSGWILGAVSPPKE